MNISSTVQVICLAASLSFSHTTYGQVTAVDYMINYNSSTCLYDCYIIVQQGTAITPLERTQTPLQMSLAVPSGLQVEIAESHNPVYGNIVPGTGTDPVEWRISSTITSPAVAPYYDFIAIQPYISPVGRYDELAPGDTVRVASLSITPAVHGVAGVRLWDNATDPNSTSLGMNGSDFSNGFTLGSTQQVYRKNAIQNHPTGHADIQGQYVITAGQQVNLIPTSGVWASNNPGIVSLVGNTATAVANGIAQLTYTSGGCEEAVILQVAASTTEANTVIGGQEADPSSVLEVISSDKGVTLPMLTFDQLSQYTSPTTGLLVQVTDGASPGLYVYTDNSWRYLDSTAAANLIGADSPSQQVVTSQTNDSLLQQADQLLNKIQQNQKDLDKLKNN